MYCWGVKFVAMFFGNFIYARRSIVPTFVGQQKEYPRLSNLVIPGTCVRTETLFNASIKRIYKYTSMIN